MKPALAVEKENAKRGVFLTSEISPGLYDRLVPEITKLRLTLTSAGFTAHTDERQQWRRA